MSDAGPLIVERKGGVVSLRFNRPAVLNAINAEMAEAIAKAVAEARADSGVRCMIISGEGRAFMAGGDVATFHAAGTEAPAEIKRLIGPLHEALAQMAEAPFPVIASIRGAAVGGGFSVALAADVAIAADDAQFAHGYTKIGASTD